MKYYLFITTHFCAKIPQYTSAHCGFITAANLFFVSSNACGSKACTCCERFHVPLYRIHPHAV